MERSLIDALCTRCALCCDGSLFADVELSSPQEATRLEILGLEIEDGDTRDLLCLPCSALQGKRCGIYAHRPRSCRTFECRLLQDARRGAVSMERASEHIDDAHRRIRRVTSLLIQLGQRDTRLPLRERVAEVLAKDSVGPEMARKRTKLSAAMSAVEALIRKTFVT